MIRAARNKVLESLCYFSSVLMLMIFLTKDMGLSDTRAGTIFGVFSASMSFFMLFVGFIADSLGIKKALTFGLLIALVGRLAITFTTNAWVVYPGLFFLSIGFAYMIPLLAAAVKLFSSRRAQKFAFSWYYVVMNVGSLAAGLALDPIREHFTAPTAFRFLGMDLAVRPSQIIFLVGVGATLVSLVLVVFFIRNHIPKVEFNPFVIIFLVPIMTAITGRMKAYNVIMVGSFIAAGSVFFMGVTESVEMIVLFQVMLSIGEAIYSPRVYDYTASIAPPGREASYMAYSKAPMFFAKVAAGPITGILLANLCPTEGPRNTELMWIIVGVSTLVSPVTLLLGRRWLDVESRERARKGAID